jgi:hypothetical protein
LIKSTLGMEITSEENWEPETCNHTAHCKCKIEPAHFPHIGFLVQIPVPVFFKHHSSFVNIMSAASKSIIGGFKSGKLLLEIVDGELSKSKAKDQIVKCVAQLVQEVQSSALIRSGARSTESILKLKP